MILRPLFWVPVFLLIFLLTPLSTVQALSTGTGTLSVQAAIVYDPNTLEWIYGGSPLETWQLGNIGPGFLASKSVEVYDEAVTPGWDIKPEDMFLSYNDSSISIANNTVSDPLNPGATSVVDMSTSGLPGVTVQVAAQIIYLANLHAIGSGSFNFYVDYYGSSSGAAPDDNDYAGLLLSINAFVDIATFDESGNLSGWGERVAEFAQQESLYIGGGETGSINMSSNRLGFTVNYNAGDRFYLRFGGENQVYGFSQNISSGSEPDPVPEPGTLLLLGSGLASLALYRRRMNKA